MRLVLLGTGYPFRGGIPRTTTGLAAALAHRGHELLFLTPRRQYPAGLFPGASDRDPEACPALPFAEPWLDPVAPHRWPVARRRAAAFGAAAWIFPYWTWVWAPMWRYLLAGRRPPVVAVVHNPEDHDAGAVQRLAARLVLSRADGLFTHAEALAAVLERRFPHRPVGWHLLPPPASRPGPGRETARARLGLDPMVRVALFWGIVRPYKGVDVLLEAAARLPAGWHVVVAGEPWGGLDRELARRAAAPDLAGRVTLRLGWVPEAEVPLLLDAADVVVLPYRSGSQSAVAPTALAHGVPVVTTAVGGLPELVEDGRCGVVVPPGDPAALAAALEGLGPERLATLAEGARRRAAELTWDAYAAALEEVILAVGRGKVRVPPR